jgi:hypothetical protein
MRNWKGLEACSLVFEVLYRDFLADGKITKPQSEQTMTLQRIETGSARTCPTIPGRNPHTKLPDVAVSQPELAGCARQC